MPAASEALAIETGDELSVYLVPAFTGLGAPYWDAEARGALYGLTRDTGIKEVVTAGLLSVCYQTRDLVEAIRGDGATLENLRVDGGMANNDWVMQKLADVLGCTVQRPTLVENHRIGWPPIWRAYSWALRNRLVHLPRAGSSTRHGSRCSPKTGACVTTQAGSRR